MNEALIPPVVIRQSDQETKRASSQKSTRRSERAMARRERDAERGYTINVKYVVLAFGVEFFIIGLILVGQYFIAEEAAREKVFSILLFPIGLAVVELARVPLAIAVRTQTAWSVKCFAALGVIAAIVVTSFSLSTIAYQTFDPRLTEANEKHDALERLRADRRNLADKINTAIADVDQKVKARENVNERYKELQSQISKLSTARGERCITITTQDGGTKRDCTPTSITNQAQHRTLTTQLENTKKELDQAENALRDAGAERAKYDPQKISQQIASAEDDYRKAVARSQLHSYTSMIMRKAPADVSEAEVKALESYLIFIPSIAAALASTLLAISAVHRIRRKDESVATIPDEAAAFLFGPLVEAIKRSASDAVAGAMAEQRKADASTGPLVNA